MATAVVSNRVSMLGKLFTSDVTITCDGAVVKDPTLAAAKDGDLTTRTSDSIGTITADSASHGVVTGDLLDVYWSGGSRTGCRVGTVSSTSIPITGGTGDVLPAAATALTFMVPQLEIFDVDYADLQCLLVTVPGSNQATARLMGSGTSDEQLVARVDTDADYIWYTGSGISNPLSANITQVYLSHSDSAASRQVSIIAGIN